MVHSIMCNYCGKPYKGVNGNSAFYRIIKGAWHKLYPGNIWTEVWMRTCEGMDQQVREISKLEFLVGTGQEFVRDLHL